MGSSHLDPLQQAFVEEADALFRREVNDFAVFTPKDSPSCPHGTVAQPVVCDCPKTRHYMGFREKPCDPSQKCIVRAVLFPNGTY